MILPEPDLKKALNLTMKCNFQWRWNVHEEEPLMLNYTLSFLFIYWGAGGVRNEEGAWRTEETRCNVYKTRRQE